MPKHFQKCFQSVGPVVEDTFRRETISTLHSEKLSRNWLLQENMESSKICFLVRPQYCPPFFDASDSSESTKDRSKANPTNKVNCHRSKANPLLKVPLRETCCEGNVDGEQQFCLIQSDSYKNLSTMCTASHAAGMACQIRPARPPRRRRQRDNQPDGQEARKAMSQ
jgi:hypothetical protein